MTFNYTLSAIMTMGHRIAKSLGLDIYREALSKGLSKAWKISKGLLPHIQVEEAKVVHEDVQQNWAHSCLGNVEVNVCAFEVAKG